MTTHENTPEVVESWEIPEEAKIVLNYPLSAEDAGELLKDIYTLIASQKQKQIEEIVGIAEGMRSKCNKPHPKLKNCGAHKHNKTVDKFITKVKAL